MSSSRYRLEVYDRDQKQLDEQTTAFRTWADRRLQAAKDRPGAFEIMIVDTFDGDRVVRHWINGEEQECG